MEVQSGVGHGTFEWDVRHQNVPHSATLLRHAYRACKRNACARADAPEVCRKERVSRLSGGFRNWAGIRRGIE